MARSQRNVRKAHRGHYKKKFTPYPFKENEELTVTIEGMTSMGHGVARVNHQPETGDAVENWVIFVPFGLAGETIKIKIVDNTKKHSTARIVDVITESEDRVAPQCKHFYHCGGCQYQHLAYPKQLEIQTDHIKEQLSRLAEIDHLVNPAIGSPKIWNYRSKITPHYKKPEKGKIKAIGFLHHSNKDQIVDLHECAIAMEQINNSLTAIKKYTQGRAFSLKEDGSVLMRVSDDKVETESNNAVTESVGDLNFSFLAKDFFQNNPSILPAFTDYVAEQAAQKGLKYLVDAYCGCGLFALSLADKFEQVAGVEVSATSTDWARYNADANNITNATFLAAKAEAIFKNISFASSETAMVVDPPRAGCSKEFLEQLFQFKPAKVVYVSCDPSTQMRDLQSFTSSGYQVDDIQPFDLFPHTRHLECVISLSLKQD